jgi:hypothetical protein
MEKKHTTIRAILWLICLYHVVFGVLANAPAETMRQLAASVLGIHLPDEPALAYVIRPFGIYVMTFGIMMGVAAWNPVKNRALISVGVVLFALRIVQRLLNLEGMQQALGVSPSRNLGTIAVVAAFGLALAWLRLQLYREMHNTAAPAKPA